MERKVRRIARKILGLVLAVTLCAVMLPSQAEAVFHQ